MANTAHRMSDFSAGDLRSPPMSPREPPACVQNAMMNKERKPFTYTPGGLDLSQIRSEKMAKRLMRNAMSPGVQEKPKQPSFVPNGNIPAQKPSINYYSLPVAVFPSIQLPANPKELLRRTSGPNNRRDSIEKELEIISVNEKKEIGIKRKESLKETVNEPIKEAEVKEIKSEIESTKNETAKTENLTEKKINGFIETTANEVIIEKSLSPVCKEEENNEGDLNSIEESDFCINASLKIDVRSKSPCSYDLGQSNEMMSVESEIQKDADINHNDIEEKIEITADLINDVCKDSGCTDMQDTQSPLIERLDDDGDITPKIDVVTHQFEPVLSHISISKNSSDTKITADSINLEAKENNQSKENVILRKSVSPSNILVQNESVCKRENSDLIAARRNSDNIKSLNCDLDNLPSLNLCSKRFSFLSENTSNDDPFSILTGIPPKISLIDNPKAPRIVEAPKLDVSPLRKTKTNDIPTIDKFINKSSDSIPKVDFWNPNKSTPDKSIECNLQPYAMTNGQNEPKINEPRQEIKLFNDFVSSIEEKENPEPAWKKELREIANQKREAKEESIFYKEEIEPPWRRELRELSQSRQVKESIGSSCDKELNWNTSLNFHKTKQEWQDKPNSISNPIWSQTLKPKTWRERKADLARDKEVDEPEWKKAGILRRSFVNSFINKSTSSSSSCSSPGREIGKPPEITVEIAGHPNGVQATPSASNGYTYPWECSSESSAAFSPEPYLFDRTPTPQSRSSPSQAPQYSIYGYPQSPVMSREYGTISYQPRRNQIRSCPIQSRSFKYLQLLTGTVDTYEDDEPFIPQPPQHALPRPENL